MRLVRTAFAAAGFALLAASAADAKPVIAITACGGEGCIAIREAATVRTVSHHLYTGYSTFRPRSPVLYYRLKLHVRGGFTRALYVPSLRRLLNGGVWWQLDSSGKTRLLSSMCERLVPLGPRRFKLGDLAK
jgi:hypothetical protein